MELGKYCKNLHIFICEDIRNMSFFIFLKGKDRKIDKKIKKPEHHSG